MSFCQVKLGFGFIVQVLGNMFVYGEGQSGINKNFELKGFSLTYNQDGHGGR